MNTAFILLPDFILILFAWAINRYTSLDKSIWLGIEKLVYWILFPALLFNASAFANIVWMDNLKMVGLLLTCMILMGLLAYSAKWFLNPDRINLTSGIQTTMRFNTFLALAVASRLSGDSGIGLIAITIAMVVPFSNLFAILTLAPNSKQSIIRELATNPYLISTLLGIVVNLLHIPIPDVLTTNLDRVGNAAVPLGLLAVGASLTWVQEKKDIGLVGWWTFLKLIAYPLFAIVGSNLLGLPSNQQLNVLLIAVMPTASSAFVLTNRMGGNGAIVSITISLQTIVATLTVPFWLYLTHYQMPNLH